MICGSWWVMPAPLLRMYKSTWFKVAAAMRTSTSPDCLTGRSKVRTCTTSLPPCPVMTLLSCVHSLPNSDHQLLGVSHTLGILIERDHWDELSNLLGVVVVCYQRANELGVAIPGPN